MRRSPLFSTILLSLGLLLPGPGCQFDGTGVKPGPGTLEDASGPSIDGPVVVDGAVSDGASPTDALVVDAPEIDAPAVDAGEDIDAPPAEEPPCMTDPGYVERPGGGRHRYRLVTTSSNWDAAQQACESDGAHLVVIEDSDEDAYLDADVGGGQDRWIGLSDRTAEDTFVWVTGAPFGYDNWEGGNAGSAGNNPNKDCVFVRGNGRWAVRKCSDPIPFICECDPNWTGP